MMTSDPGDLARCFLNRDAVSRMRIYCNIDRARGERGGSKRPTRDDHLGTRTHGR